MSFSYRGYSRHLHSGRCCPIKREAKSGDSNRLKNEVVWVNMRYNPRDLRPNMPMPLSPLKSEIIPFDRVPDSWMRARGISSRQVSRGLVETEHFRSQPATRDENWSSLREMTPSIGRSYKHRPPSWGVSGDVPPEIVAEFYERFPRVSSSMSRHREDEQYCYHNMPHIGLVPVKQALANVKGSVF